MPETIHWNGEQLYVRLSTYPIFGNPLIVLETEYGEPYAIASVNPYKKLDDGLVAIKNWGENEGIDKALIKAGIISPEPVARAQSEYVSIQIHKLLAAADCAGMV